MNFLRTASTKRLIATGAGVLALAGAGTTIALAAGGNTDVPPAKPLAEAVHDAAVAPAVPGISARITFSNRLIDGASFQGSDPVIAGAKGRLWMSQDGHARLELQSDAGDAQVVSDGKTVTLYDGTTNTAYSAALPQDRHSEKEHGVPSVADIQDHLNELMQHANLSGAQPSNIAGRPAYTVKISPKHDGGLLGGAQVAWDAANGVPLKASVFEQGEDKPVLELKATDVSFEAIPAGTFDVKPPAGAKLTTLSTPEDHPGVDGKRSEVTGLDAVQAKVPFKVSAPDQLVGLPRKEVKLLNMDDKTGAVAFYGEGIGGIAVIQTAADPNGDDGIGQAKGRHDTGFNLPTVSIGSATGQELDTALGTVIHFTRDGVSYTVIGSVPPAAAESAARGL